MSNAGRIAYKLTYEINPIFLVGGVAQNAPGQVIPIVALTEGAAATTQAAGKSFDLDLDKYFAHFEPMPGTTLIANEIGHYPFANQAVAANAIVMQPLVVSLLMKCPVNGDTGYLTRTATLTILQQTLFKHNQLGGTYTVLTPAYVYTNCILKAMRDATTGESRQKQIMFQLDFEQPLITQAAATAANSSYIAKIASGIAP